MEEYQRKFENLREQVEDRDALSEQISELKKELQGKENELEESGKEISLLQRQLDNRVREKSSQRITIRGYHTFHE